MRQIIIPLFICMMILSCTGKRTGTELVDDASLRQAFDELTELDSVYGMARRPYHNLDIKDLCFDDLTAHYGDFVAEYVDTFRYGAGKENKSYYDYFMHPDFTDIISREPFIVIHEYLWPIVPGKGLRVYFVDNGVDSSKPIWGQEFTYTLDMILLWSLPEKYLTLAQVISERGAPIADKIDTLYYGTKDGWSYLDVIEALKDVPEEVVHRYDWAVDSKRKLRLFFVESDNVSTEKAIWGYQYNPFTIMDE